MRFIAVQYEKKGGEAMLLNVGLPLTIAGTAVLMDLRMERVENGWILLSMAAAFFWRMLQEGLGGIPGFILGMLLPLAALGGLFYFRMLGPGDIKLFCALGCAMGPSAIWKCIICSFMLGAAISFAILIFYSSFLTRIRYLIRYFHIFFRTGEVTPYYMKGMTLENFHFTVPVFMSVMLYAGGVY